MSMQLPDVLPGIQIAATLRRIGNRPALLVELLNELARDHAGVLDQVPALLAGGQHDEALRRAHSIKGLALNLGCDTLATTSAALEAALKNGSPDVDEKLAAALVAFAEVQASVKVLQARLVPQD